MMGTVRTSQVFIKLNKQSERPQYLSHTEKKILCKVTITRPPSFSLISTYMTIITTKEKSKGGGEGQKERRRQNKKEIHKTGKGERMDGKRQNSTTCLRAGKQQERKRGQERTVIVVVVVVAVMKHTKTRTHARTHPPPSHTHTETHTHACVHTHTHDKISRKAHNPNLNYQTNRSSFKLSLPYSDFGGSFSFSSKTTKRVLCIQRKTRLALTTSSATQTQSALQPTTTMHVQN